MPGTRRKPEEEGGRAGWRDGGGNTEAPPAGLVPEDPAVASQLPQDAGLEVFSAAPLVPTEHKDGEPLTTVVAGEIPAMREAPLAEMGGAKVGDLASGKTTSVGSRKKPPGGR